MQSYGKLTGIVKYLHDENGKQAAQVITITSGNTETVYLLFNIDPADTVTKAYIRKLVTVTDSGTETFTAYHANGLWANRATLTYSSIAVGNALN